MYSEKRNVCQLVALLKAHNISRFVVSPGSRHIPIVISMEADHFFELYSVVDERGASFFAIGLMQRFKEPVGVICTSGTASANYCSAINECLYQELPLLVLTADRQESLRDQHEDQMIRQSTMYTNITKMVANLPLVNDENDAWFNNRLINEALLELTHHGCGPVQINIPIPQHLDEFTTKEMPIERKITRYEMDNVDWNKVSKELKGKKILIVCGEGLPFTEEQTKIFNDFCNQYNAVVLCDKMSNCHLDNSIENGFPTLQVLTGKDISELSPDIIFTIRNNFSFNPEFKGFVRAASHFNKAVNWLIHPSGRVIDPYQGLLTEIFEMDEIKFFRELLSIKGNAGDYAYVEMWKIISKSIAEPDLEFGQINAIGHLLKNIPSNSILQLANSNAVRMAQLFHIDKTVEIHCNRGTDGIDGCMSTTIGYASETDKLTFLLIGDLTFFYDMNSLWIRHLQKNVRILLINNGGGSVMHLPARPEFALELMPQYISAHHTACAKAWAEDRGFKYISARSEDEIISGIQELISKDSDKPVILEVFSEMVNDISQYKGYYATVHRHDLEQAVQGKDPSIIRKVLKILGIEPSTVKEAIKNTIGENRARGLKMIIKN